jgi:N6-L-threonylcarbamoyladenine synthase
MLVLGIETSCDETSAAVVRDGRDVLSNVVTSQVEIHQRYRGVVPEIASREHTRAMLPVVEEGLRQASVELSDVDAIAVTAAPGLIGSLLVGLSAARTLALIRGVPLVEMDHLEAHVFSPALVGPLEYPLVGLVVSGGHTDIYLSGSETRYERLGHTIDDAAGEAFDKVAAVLGLPYPGGPSIEKAARDGDPGAAEFPKSYLEPGSFDFSFSGIKTAVLYHGRGKDGKGEIPADLNIGDVAASFQKAMVEVLVDKTVAAAEAKGVRTVSVGGGVACNSVLREAFEERGKAVGLDVRFPPREYCTDNAAMIAGLGYHYLSEER